MLKTLLNLWWIQKKRTFDWKRMGWFLYVLLIITSGIIGGYIQVRKDGSFDMHNDLTQKLVIPLVMTFSLFGILMKLLMKQEAAGMDDYIKSRPILESSWNNESCRLLELGNSCVIIRYVMFHNACWICNSCIPTCVLCQYYRRTHAYVPS